MSRSTCAFSVSYSIKLPKSAPTCPTTIMAFSNYFYKILLNDLWSFVKEENTFVMLIFSSWNCPLLLYNVIYRKYNLTNLHSHSMLTICRIFFSQRLLSTYEHLYVLITSPSWTNLSSSKFWYTFLVFFLILYICLLNIIAIHLMVLQLSNIIFDIPNNIKYYC